MNEKTNGIFNFDESKEFKGVEMDRIKKVINDYVMSQKEKYKKIYSDIIDEDDINFEYVGSSVKDGILYLTLKTLIDKSNNGESISMEENNTFEFKIETKCKCGGNCKCMSDSEKSEKLGKFIEEKKEEFYDEIVKIFGGMFNDINFNKDIRYDFIKAGIFVKFEKKEEDGKSIVYSKFYKYPEFMGECECRKKEVKSVNPFKKSEVPTSVKKAEWIEQKKREIFEYVSDYMFDDVCGGNFKISLNDIKVEEEKDGVRFVVNLDDGNYSKLRYSTFESFPEEFKIKNNREFRSNPFKFRTAYIPSSLSDAIDSVFDDFVF